MENKKICMIAHRGFSANYPDNTEIAFIKAAENGSGGAETDVRITKDGILVTNHNDEVVFEDGTELLVAEATYEELTAKPMKNKKSDDVVYLCTFRRYLEIMKENNMVCFMTFRNALCSHLNLKILSEPAKCSPIFRLCLPTAQTKQAMSVALNTVSHLMPNTKS